MNKLKSLTRVVERVSHHIAVYVIGFEISLTEAVVDQRELSLDCVVCSTANLDGHGMKCD